MAKITLTVIADTQKAQGTLDALKKHIDSTFGKPLEIKVAASGLDDIVSKLQKASAAEAKAAEAAAKLANAEARKINAQTKAAESAAKLERAQKKQTETAQATAKATEKLVYNSEQLARKFMETAQSNDYLEKKLHDLYQAFLQESGIVNSGTQALVLFADSTSLVVQNATATETAIRRLAGAYLELAAAAQGGGAGGNVPGSGNAGGFTQKLLSSGVPARTSGNNGVQWSRYGDWRDNVIDVDYRPVTDAANAAGQAASRAASSFNTLGDSARAAWAKMKEGTPVADALGDSIGNIIVKIATWQVVNGIVAGIKRSFTDALDTMKAVDSELVTVRKVTGFTADEMKRVEEQAYKTASAYGVAADTYLESVAAFARAGYKEQSEDLAELSTKTQIVGDTTAEVANQFLLSVDAAYKYKGSIEELSKVLDGSNELDNKYATSIEKIAEGMGIVAPVAAQMNVSIDELAAAIGTITAVTQRSGSEAARALRALFLNIAGDTKTEIDEGVTWTTGEIAGLRDVIKLYAKDAYDAAQATGSVIDPMKAMEGLAKSMQDGLLTEQKLIEMVSDIGGKLRTSQLLAIIQNWDMYQSMLTDYAGAIGSADKEVENALDSWERKTAQLDNAFTEFISHIVDTGAIKTIIDGLTGVVKLLDSGVGKIGALSAAFLALGKVGGMIVTSRTVREIRDLNAGLAIVPQTALGAAHAVEGLGNKFKTFTSVLLQNPAVIATAIAAALYALKELDDALTTTTDEYADKVREQIKAYEDATAELEELNKKAEENNRLIAESNELGQDDSYRKRLEEENGRLEEQIRLARERQNIALAQAGQAAVGLAGGQFGIFDSNETLSFISKLGVGPNPSLSLQEYFTYLKGWSESGLPLAKDASEALKDLTDDILDARDSLIAIRDALGSLTPEQEAALALFDQIIGSYVQQIDVRQGNATQIDLETEAIEEEIDVLKQLNDEIDNVQSALKTIRAAQDEYNQSGEISVETLQALLQLEPEYLAALIDENGQINLNSEAVSTLIDGKNVLLERLAAESVATYAAKEAERLLAEQEGNAGTAAETAAGKLDIASSAASLLAENAVKGASGVTALDISLQKLAGKTGLKKNYAKELIDNVSSYAAALSGAIGSTSLGLGGWAPSSSGSSRSGGGSSGSSAGSDKDHELERLKDAVALEKQRLSFLETSNASEEEQIAKMREVQDALHAQADYMRSIGASEKDVLALSTEWWQYQNKIDKLLEDAAKKAQEAAEAEAKALREGIASTLEGINEELEKQAELATSPLQEELDALKAAHDLRKEDTEEAEKLLAVEKARIALENAERERNVRVYNAKTGQWEWVANAQTVASARENLTAAQKALDDFYAENAYNAKVKALEERIESTSGAFKELIKAITDAAKAVRDGSMTGDEAYAGIGAAMEGIDPIYRQGLAGALIGRMKANSAAWHNAGPDERAELEAQNLAIGTSLGWHRGADGVWYDAVGSRAYDRWTDADVVSPFGFGSAVSGTGYDAMLRSMGIVTSAGGAGGGYAGGTGGTSIGEQHNGDVYQIGGVTLTEGQARGMTVFDLVQMAGGLALHGG